MKFKLRSLAALSAAAMTIMGVSAAYPAMQEDTLVASAADDTCDD